ncbi:MAG TPA: hypothetical protein VFP93_03920, partial [Gammaproteobacteria bacterium]|nr:hypothetical protein [Gammaproteobacteria bacterium]
NYVHCCHPLNVFQDAIALNYDVKNKKKLIMIRNIKVIESTNHHEIILALEDLSIKGAHFTNGTYAYAAALIVPTVLAGVKRVIQTQMHLPIIIAVNSDESMCRLGKQNFESQSIRSQKVAEPLAKAFPNNQIVVVYYDETTPTELYKVLSAKNFTRTLHKWGYGTDPKQPKIEGAEYFEMVYAFPLPNDIKPICYYDTHIASEPQKIIVDDLRDNLISREGLILFDLPEELSQYQAKEKSTRKLSYSDS